MAAKKGTKKGSKRSTKKSGAKKKATKKKAKPVAGPHKKVLGSLEGVHVPEGYMGYVKHTKQGLKVEAVKRKVGGTRGAKRKKC